MEYSNTEMRNQNSTTKGVGSSNIHILNSSRVKIESTEFSSEESGNEFEMISNGADTTSSQIECLVDPQPEYVMPNANIHISTSSELGQNGDSQNVLFKQFTSNDDVHQIIASEMNRVEENLSRMLSKRIHKMERKIVEFQRNMLNDILLVSKEQKVNKCSTDVIYSVKDFSYLPLNSVEKMFKFDDQLKSDYALQNNLISCLFGINCNSPGEYIRICWSKILTDKVATHFSWRHTSTKGSIHNRSITKVVKRAFEYKFPLNQEKFSNATKKFFQYAPDRACPLEIKDLPPLEMESVIPVLTEMPIQNNNETNQTLLIDPNFQTTISQTLESSYSFVLPAAAVSSPNGNIQRKKTHKSRKRLSKRRNPPKTGAERSREYRLRKKSKKLNVPIDQMNENQPITIESSTNSIPFNQVPKFNEFESLHKMISNNELNIPLKTEQKKTNCTPVNGEMPKTRTMRKSKFNDIMHSNTLLQSIVGNNEYAKEYEVPALRSSSKRQQRSSVYQTQNFNIEQMNNQPKTSAERSRAYRMRKKLKQAESFQLSQLHNECSLTSDPRSHDSSDAILNQTLLPTKFN